ncbi:MAG: DEAD/DEAH box helicase [Chloroflexi bacterium]|nr:DEAD/DEAH box helicase [Chloroflexota bacterium]
MDIELAVEKIKGIGPKTSAILHKAGIFTLKDLLYTLPRDYENYQTPTKISHIRPGKVVVKGKISQLHTRHTARRRLSITEGVIRDDTDAIRVVWFNQHYRTQQFIEDKEYYFSGVYEFARGRYQLTSPSACLASDVEKNDAFQPIYVAHSKLKSSFFKRLFNNLRPEFALIPDLLPPHHMAPARARAESLFKVHFPANESDVTTGRKYLAYEELFQLILASKLNQAKNQQLVANPLDFSTPKTKELVARLPFKLTNAQRIAAWDILQDLTKTTPMNRLLQGDVGSGKTVVAALAIAQAAWNQQQSVLLAPTAILATQHFETLKKLLAPFDFKIALLTGATKTKAALKKQIAAGEIDLVVGTHAILTDDTIFHSLALCIIDE